jgi:hypothetical protein
LTSSAIFPGKSIGIKNKSKRIEPMVIPVIFRILTTIDFDGFFMLQK